MGEIILFPPQKGQVSQTRGTAEGAVAQIMFFTGVRYERAQEALPVDHGADSGAPPAGGFGGARPGRRRRRG